MEREQATKFIYDLLRALLAKKGSDLFITSGFPPAMKIDSKMTPVSQQPLNAQHTAMLVRAIMNDKQAAEFESTKECNFAINPAGIGRFRVNAFVQQANVRSEEHTSELQSRLHLVCRLLLEKKKKQ